MTTDLRAAVDAVGASCTWIGSGAQVLATTPSTNDEALRLLADGAGHGTLVVADRQTCGRGRLGADWWSPAGVGLYVSLVLRGATEIESPTTVVAAVGLGIAEGVRDATGLELDIKWPNDVWHGGRKVAGVLVESRGFDPRRPALVAGFGINVNHRRADLPPPLHESAASLAMVAGRRLDRAAVLAAVLTALEPRLDQALAGECADLEENYRALSCLRGTDVHLLDGDEPVRGRVEDVSARNGLLLRLVDGTVRHVKAEHAREVRPVG